MLKRAALLKLRANKKGFQVSTHADSRCLIVVKTGSGVPRVFDGRLHKHQLIVLEHAFVLVCGQKLLQMGEHTAFRSNCKMA